MLRSQRWVDLCGFKNSLLLCTAGLHREALTQKKHKANNTHTYTQRQSDRDSGRVNGWLDGWVGRGVGRQGVGRQMGCVGRWMCMQLGGDAGKKTDRQIGDIHG